MDDDSALLVDVDIYNGELFFETLCNVIGDRELSIYITHAHGDHWINLAKLDMDRVTALYWPKGDELSIGGRDFVVCSMAAHTPTALVDKTDKVLFCGDTLGTLQYMGGTNTAMEAYADK